MSEKVERVRQALETQLGDLGAYIDEQIGDEGMIRLTCALMDAMRQPTETICPGCGRHLSTPLADSLKSLPQK